MSLACAAVAFLLVLGLTILVVSLLSRREYVDLDRRLSAASQALLPTVIENFPDGLTEPVENARGRRLLRVLAPGLVATAGQDGNPLLTVSADDASGGAPPALPVGTVGSATVELNGVDYRLITVAVDGTPGATLTVGIPAEVAAAPVRAIRLTGLIVGLFAALAGAGLGWLAAGIALRPLWQLRDRTRSVDGRGPMPTRAELTAGAPGSAAETEDLADAIAGLLQRVQLARDETDRTLQNARDFAAAADHELRTPLTTIQTDLDVLLAHPHLDAEQRREILEEVVGAKSRMLETLQALRALADGDVAAGGHGPHAMPVEVGDIASRAVEFAQLHSGDVSLTVVLPDHDAMVLGSPGGLRLAIENLISNALRHAQARQIEVSVARYDGWIVVRVDDDGVGLPAAERERVLERFTRGSQAVGSGSGLGLALVAQQAQLHGGRVRLTDSPRGGLCAELLLPAATGRP